MWKIVENKKHFDSLFWDYLSRVWHEFFLLHLVVLWLLFYHSNCSEHRIKVATTFWFLSMFKRFWDWKINLSKYGWKGQNLIGKQTDFCHCIDPLTNVNIVSAVRIGTGQKCNKSISVEVTLFTIRNEYKTMLIYWV